MVCEKANIPCLLEEPDLRFWYSNLNQLLLKAYILTKFSFFLFIGDHMVIGY